MIDKECVNLRSDMFKYLLYKHGKIDGYSKSRFQFTLFNKSIDIVSKITWGELPLHVNDENFLDRELVAYRLEHGV